MITAAQARALLCYDPRSGRFTWRVDRPCGPGRAGVRSKAGAIAGSETKAGYWRLVIDGKTYFAHRVAWLMHYGEWPNGQLDHVNGKKADNRIANLRKATYRDNTRNRGHELGHFATAEAAARAYAKASRKLHGAFSNLGRASL